MQDPAPAGAPATPAAASRSPLSPHLQVYRLALTTVLSGLHRLAGILLSAAIPLLLVWLMALAAGADSYARALRFFGSWPLRLILAGVLAAWWYHLFNGLRHLAWDAGAGFELRQARASGLAVILLSAAAFAATIFLTPAWRWLAGTP